MLARGKMRKIALVLGLLLVQTVAAACPTNSKFQDRVFPIASNGRTMAAELGKDASSRDALSRIVKHYRGLGKRRAEPNPVSERWFCEDTRNGKLEGMLGGASEQTELYGWGKPVPCVAELDEGGPSGYRQAEQLYRDIKTFSKKITSVGVAVLREYGLQWREVHSSQILEYDVGEHPYRVCKLASSVGYRHGGRWSVSAVLTNMTLLKVAPAGTRGYFAERITDPGSAPLFAPMCTGPNNAQVRNVTASVANWAGRPSWTHFASSKLEENPALQAALRRGEHPKELVEDSDTASSIAILLLPAGLALVPIGLFEDVSLALTLMYIVATDIVSVLPVAIKGIELLIYAAQKHYAIVSYMYGGETLRDVAVAETWVASCGMRGRVSEKGIALLLTAVVAMLLGLVLEFATRWKTSKYRFRRNEIHAMEQLSANESGGLLFFKSRSGDSALRQTSGTDRPRANLLADGIALRQTNGGEPPRANLQADDVQYNRTYREQLQP